MSPPSTEPLPGITLVWVVDESVDITPEPDEAERKAILAAFAADEAMPPPRSAWADAALPARDGEDDAP